MSASIFKSNNKSIWSSRNRVSIREEEHRLPLKIVLSVCDHGHNTLHTAHQSA